LFRVKITLKVIKLGTPLKVIWTNLYF
jgi:hypothetical protein